MTTRGFAAAVALLAATTAGPARAESAAPPWIDPSAPALPSWAKSVRVMRGDEPLFSAPAHGASRRGTASREALLPIFATRSGPGCGGAWLEVGPFAWLCSELVQLSGNPWIGANVRTYAATSDGLPFKYYFVGPDGSAAYKSAEDVDVGEPAMQLEKGFAVAIVAERTIDGGRYGMTEHGLWVPMRDLGPVHSFAFKGETLDGFVDDRIGVGWVITDKARVFSKPLGGALTSKTLAKFETVKVLGEATSLGASWVKIGESEWVKANDVRHPSRADAPSEVDVDAGEKWIDVDITTQTLVAYEGKKPVFATIVSTGKGKEKTPLATPKGVHRIWIKLLVSDMDNLEDENAARYYRIEDVPWVQYFSKGVGLHGAFWHRSFGHVRSHGCVNLAPLDAERLFWWTGPHLPAGWTAVFPTALEQGTVVRVR